MEGKERKGVPFVFDVPLDWERTKGAATLRTHALLREGEEKRIQVWDEKRAAGKTAGHSSPPSAHFGLSVLHRGLNSFP